MGIFSNFHYGVCYYPEHWHPGRHESDIRRIAAAGFNLVRMGEGAWGYWEPEEGQYQFELFDRVIGLCRKYGVKVLLGTPTYCAPAWVSAKYPEVLRWNFQRIPMAHGSRRNFNYTSEKYLDLSDKLCTALAKHYRAEPQVIGWQLDNEFNCHMDVSYAPSDTREFRRWLKTKYRTLPALNKAWGTAFWSQQYSDWEQIDLPSPTATYANPTQLLDESRFISDCVVRFAARQGAILRKANPRWEITHNGIFGNVDGYALTKVLDFYSQDQYPLFYEGWERPAANLQRSRSRSFPFAIMEQQSGPGGQMEYLQPTPQPGQIRLWAWQTVAHGAKMVEYFRWRTCPYGSEQHWHGIIDQDDRDNRRLAEVKRTGQEFFRLPPAFFDAPPPQVVAVMEDYDNTINEGRINTYNATGRGESVKWMVECSRRHVPADIVPPHAKLVAGQGRAAKPAYRLLIVPHFRIVTPDLVASLKQYVEAGGTLVLGAQSGIKDINAHIVEMPLPGLLRGLTGLEIEEWTTLAKDQTRTAVFPNGQTVALQTFVERLKPRTAKVLATWAGDDAILGRAPAITCHAVGAGRVVYVGGYHTDASLGYVLDLLAGELSIQPIVEATSGVEAVARGSGRRRWVVVLNHTADAQPVARLPEGLELLSRKKITNGQWTLPAYGIAIVQTA